MMSEHRCEVDWLIHDRANRRAPVRRSWRLRCPCGYRGSWVSQQWGPVSKAKAEVAAFDSHH